MGVFNRAIGAGVLVGSCVAGAFGHGGAPGEHLLIGYYFGHDGSFEAPAQPPAAATLLVDTHPWELDGVVFALPPVQSFLFDGWLTDVPGFEPLAPAEQEFDGHGYYSYLDPSFTGGSPSVRLHVVSIDAGLELLIPPLFTPMSAGQSIALGFGDFHNHPVFYLDRSVTAESGRFFTVTLSLTDDAGVLAASEPFTLRFRTGEACPADYNGDGAVGDVFDLFDFLADLDAGADYNGDGAAGDIFDLFDFLAELDAGCP